MPPVSILIPAYNRASFLRPCIDSALSQDYPSFEVVVVDDGSTDDTPQVCASYGDRIRYFRKTNGGTASALNLGLEKMNGAWFKWLSSDDMLRPSALRSLVARGVESGAGVVYGDLVEVDSKGRFRRNLPQAAPRTGTAFAVRLWMGFVGSALGAVVRRDCFQKVGGFDPTIGYAEDYDWWLRAALIHGVRFVHVPAAVAMYRVHPGQISKQRRMMSAATKSLIHRRVSALLEEAVNEDSGLGRRYTALTLQLRRTWAPILPVARLLRPLPRSGTAGYWAGRLFPGVASAVFWALEPPTGFGLGRRRERPAAPSLES